MPSNSETRVPAAAIRSFMTDAFCACGLPAADAAITAGAMLDPDLSGSDAHGIFRLPGYVRTLKRGHINVRPDIRVIERSPATALVDGDNGMGHLVMTYVANTAVEMARETGLAWVGARRSNHAGAASTYAAIPLEHGMVGIYSAVSGSNFMAWHERAARHRPANPDQHALWRRQASRSLERAP